MTSRNGINKTNKELDGAAQSTDEQWVTLGLVLACMHACIDAVAPGSPQRDRRSLRRRKNDLSRGVIPDWEIAIFIVILIDFRNNLINFPSAPFQRPCSQD